MRADFTQHWKYVNAIGDQIGDLFGVFTFFVPLLKLRYLTKYNYDKETKLKCKHCNVLKIIL